MRRNSFFFKRPRSQDLMNLNLTPKMSLRHLLPYLLVQSSSNTYFHSYLFRVPYMCLKDIDLPGLIEGGLLHYLLNHLSLISVLYCLTASISTIHPAVLGYYIHLVCSVLLLLNRGRSCSDLPFGYAWVPRIHLLPYHPLPYRS